MFLCMSSDPLVNSTNFKKGQRGLETHVVWEKVTDLRIMDLAKQLCYLDQVT